LGEIVAYDVKSSGPDASTRPPSSTRPGATRPAAAHPRARVPRWPARRRGDPHARGRAGWEPPDFRARRRVVAPVEVYRRRSRAVPRPLGEAFERGDSARRRTRRGEVRLRKLHASRQCPQGGADRLDAHAGRRGAADAAGERPTRGRRVRGGLSRQGLFRIGQRAKPHARRGLRCGCRRCEAPVPPKRALPDSRQQSTYGDILFWNTAEPAKPPRHYKGPQNRGHHRPGVRPRRQSPLFCRRGPHDHALESDDQGATGGSSGRGAGRTRAASHQRHSAEGAREVHPVPRTTRSPS